MLYYQEIKKESLVYYHPLALSSAHQTLRNGNPGKICVCISLMPTKKIVGTKNVKSTRIIGLFTKLRKLQLSEIYPRCVHLISPVCRKSIETVFVVFTN